MPVISPLLNLKTLFRKNDFSGGLNAQLDPTKNPANSYPLLVNGRSRENVISPTNRHVQIAAPTGNYQGLYMFGTFLLLFVDGIAYYADITQSPIIFRVVDNWVPMDSSVERIFAELAPATANLYNRQGNVNTVTKVFNATIGIFEEAIYCFDGTDTHPPQAINTTPSAAGLGSFATWTKDNPLYVPSGKFPAFAGAKLYLASTDLKRVLDSVSGRPSDFVINIDNNGDKGGDADTTSQTVSFNDITAIRAISTGEILVGTLYGTFTLTLDYTNSEFGEPYLQPTFLFPTGPVNEISLIDVLSDTAFITQSGIHAFNAVMQAKRESNNFPFGAPIRKLITNPNTRKAIVQSKTCCGLYDDYVFFAMNTAYGYGAIVFDTTTQTFQSLDLSFGHVKQFATTKVSGNERMFYITHENAIYEAFADTEKNPCRALLGEWTPGEAPSEGVLYMMDTIFTNVVGSGQVKLSFYADRVLKDTAVLEVRNGVIVNNLPIPVPFTEGYQVAAAGFHFSGHYRAWKCAAMVEWNFPGDLANISIDGKLEVADNVRLVKPIQGTVDVLAFMADSGYSDELNTGGVFDANELVVVSVVKGSRYAFDGNGNGPLVNGQQLVNIGVFTAAGDTVAIKGTNGDPKTFSLRTADNYLNVVDAIRAEKIQTVLHGGDFAAPAGSVVDVTLADLAANYTLLPVAGEQEWDTNAGVYFYNKLKVPRYYSQDFQNVSVFLFNGNTTEPDGIHSGSIQVGEVLLWLNASTKPFNILVTHFPPYSNASGVTPRADLQFLLNLPKLSAMICGHANNMERFGQFGAPLFICGAGGQTLGGFLPEAEQIASAYQNSTTFGFIKITADALSCRVAFKDIQNNELDAFTLYSK